jgi:hypothetical protein
VLIELQQKKQKGKIYINFSYPGGKCTVDTDCIGNNQCIVADGICKGNKANDDCSNTNDCLIGLSCQKDAATSKSTCQAQLPEGATGCVDDFDCVNTAGCLNSTCTPYFSQTTGTDVGKEKRNELFFCETGAADADGKCYTRTNSAAKNTECSTAVPCAYSDGKPQADDCQCSRSKEGKKYCALGNGEKENLDYIKSLKNLLKQTSNVCHTSERGATCSEVVNNRPDLSTIVNTNFFKYSSFVPLTGTEDCIRSYYYTSYNPAFTRKCPNITCNKDLKDPNCAEIVGKDDGSKSVALKACTDKDKNKCYVSNRDIFVSQTATKTCSVPDVVKSSNRLPGEKCDTNNTCNVGECKSDKCELALTDNACTDTKQCPVGKSCQAGKCANQLSKGAECTSEFDCKNGLGCALNKDGKNVCTE